MKQVFALFVFAVVLVGCSKNMPKAETPSADAYAQAMPEMTPEEMMAKVKEAGSPGDEHQQLQPLVGKWKAEVKTWMAPNSDPIIETGQADVQWTLGKRFIREKYKGSWQGEPFEGEGLLGFDKVRGEYVSTWTDSVSTGIMTAEGTYHEPAKEIEMFSTYSCPMHGGVQHGRSVRRIVSDNKQVLEMYQQNPDGTEIKVMEITYTRKS